MHDIRFIRENPEEFDRQLSRRGIAPISEEILEIDSEWRKLTAETQEFQSKRKSISKEIGLCKRQKQPSDHLEAEVLQLKKSLELSEEKAKEEASKLQAILETIPNLLSEEVPEGKGEEENQIVHEWGKKPDFSFEPRQHFDLGEKLGQMDFPTATKISGARFTILRGGLARLERALGQFMLDLHTQKFGFEETSVPILVNEEAMYGTDKLPKFAEESFQTTDGRWLIPTGEVSLTAMQAEEIIPEEKLPLRMTALTACFRSEAGAAGRDVRGMIRQHQFVKCELVAVTKPEESDAEHERLTRASETVLELLELPYRRMLLCAGDTGFGSTKTWDLEVWLPGAKAWREISSCSNTKEFQARRMNARYRSQEGLKFVHTLNGSGLAVGRTLVAVMENYQTEEGHIRVPKALLPYMGGLEIIS
ncbi:serine--tRNA ligase [Acetobacteraceae bacterium]|nr:serine--tRNA ligase [Acetobacteraceae bacterium]